MQGDYPLGVVKHQIEPHIGLNQACDTAHHEAEHGTQSELEGWRHLDGPGQPDGHHRGEYGEAHGKELTPGDKLAREQPHHHRL